MEAVGESRDDRRVSAPGAVSTGRGENHPAMFVFQWVLYYAKSRKIKTRPMITDAVIVSRWWGWCCNNHDSNNIHSLYSCVNFRLYVIIYCRIVMAVWSTTTIPIYRSAYVAESFSLPRDVNSILVPPPPPSASRKPSPRKYRRTHHVRYTFCAVVRPAILQVTIQLLLSIYLLSLYIIYVLYRIYCSCI